MKRISSIIIKTLVKSQKDSLTGFSDMVQNTPKNTRALVAFKDLKHYHDISVFTILRKRFQMPSENTSWVTRIKVINDMPVIEKPFSILGLSSIKVDDLIFA
jgi:hypothetical protein